MSKNVKTYPTLFVCGQQTLGDIALDNGGRVAYYRVTLCNNASGTRVTIPSPRWGTFKPTATTYIDIGANSVSFNIPGSCEKITVISGTFINYMIEGYEFEQTEDFKEEYP